MQQIMVNRIEDIMGKLTGAVVGFSVFLSPVGILGGVLVGALFDFWLVKIYRPNREKEQWQQEFSVATVQLLAKMAKADGTVSREDLYIFRSYFFIPKRDEVAMGKLFNSARKEVNGAEDLIEELKYLCADQPQVLTHIFHALCAISVADNLPPHPAQLDLLNKVISSWHISAQVQNDVEKELGIKGGKGGGAPKALQGPYKILGVENSATEVEIRKAYKKLVKENHPDLLTAKGASKKELKQAEDKLAALNNAYQEIMK